MTRSQEGEQGSVGGVIAGVDGSPEAGEALRYAAEWASLRRQPLVVVHAYRPPPPVPWPSERDLPPGPTGSRRAAETVLADSLVGLGLAPQQQLVARVELGSASRVLSIWARRAALVVLGQHRFSLDDQALAGPVASTLAAAAPCPVVVVPGGWRRLWGRQGRYRDPVVVALDGRSGAQAALDLTFEAAETTYRPVLAIQAVPDREGRPDEAGRGLAELVAGHAAAHPDVSVITDVAFGEVEDVLLDAAQRASLLVMARPHRSGSAAWRRSVARSLIGRTACPLAIVPSSPTSTELALPRRATTTLRPTASSIGLVRATLSDT